MPLLLEAHLRLNLPPVAVPREWPDAPDLLDPDDPDQGRAGSVRELLANIQGNILKSHGRDHAALLYFQVAPDRVGRRDPSFWQDIESKVTWAWVQREQTLIKKMSAEKFRQYAVERALIDGIKPAQRISTVFRGFALSAAGMAALGVMDSPATNQAVVLPHPFAGSAVSFNAGMRRMFGQAGIETELTGWEQHFTEGVHGIWLIASANREELRTAVRELRTWCGQNGLVAARKTQWLTTWRTRDKDKLPREPFGFVDGISVPAFFASDKKAKILGGKWMEMPLKQVLIPEEASADHAGGSFLVLRKLEQNVALFRRKEAELTALGSSASLLVGRDRQGCPMARSITQPPEVRAKNAFDFMADRSGQRCPLHAHIRKMNPRVEFSPTGDNIDNAMGEDILNAQLVRRGMVFDPRGKLKAAERAGGQVWPDRGVGLCFMAYMSNISKQFEKLQQHWVHDPDFPRAGSAPDSVLAAQEGTRDAPYDALPQFVTSRGGEYFYVPSRRWLLTR